MMAIDGQMMIDYKDSRAEGLPYDADKFIQLERWEVFGKNYEDLREYVKKECVNKDPFVLKYNESKIRIFFVDILLKPGDKIPFFSFCDFLNDTVYILLTYDNMNIYDSVLHEISHLRGTVAHNELDLNYDKHHLSTHNISLKFEGDRQRDYIDSNGLVQ
jgi:hypothetical protein